MTDWSGCGLRGVEGEPIPLRSVEMVGEVVCGQLRIAHRQRYENRESRPIEAIYVFPVPSAASVVGFAMETGGRRLESQLKEREAAFDAYYDAVQSGDGAALLESERSNVFTASVGNLMPGESATIELEYVQRLCAEEGALRIALPSLVAPRYIPGAPQGDRTAHGTAEPTAEVPDADRITPRVGPADYGLALDLCLRADGELRVESPSHRLVTTPIERGVRVRFAQERVPLDRDVILSVEAQDAAELSSVCAHKRGDSGYVAVSYVPDLGLELAAQPRTQLDVAFVLDRSGSMEGSSIDEALKALRLCLRQLREGDHFSIFRFSDDCESFHREPVPFTQRTLEEADAWLAKTRASGGTELLDPLLAALDRVRTSDPAREACVVLLTDGQVGDEARILKKVLARSATARVYTFGIGTNVSDALLLQLADKTHGAAEFIHPGERVDEKVVAIFARAIASRVHDLRAHWSDVNVSDLAPADPPPLVDGEPWLWSGRYRTPGAGTLELRGTLRGQPWSRRLPASLPAAAEAPGLPQLWAAERIRDLEAAQLAGASLEKRITALALEHGLASRFTSFVVLEHRDEAQRAKDAPRARPIAVHAPAGWAMFERPRPARMMLGSMLAMPVRTRSPAPYSLTPTAAPMQIKLALHARGESLVAGARVSAGLSPGAGATPGWQRAAARSAGFRPDDRSFGHRPSGVDPAFAILSRQLASGLWDDRDSNTPSAEAASTARAEESRVHATAGKLIELLRLGVDASHRQYGPLVRKAVDALVPLAAALAARNSVEAERALSAAWLLTTGRRTRQTLRAAIQAAALTELESLLQDERALRTKLLGTRGAPS